ncbi:MAG: (2Fe-2S)-binding protein [Chloroflexi bacterium]|jgi:ferredoxin|uniref:(2Fe-2S)-binding protein n=1 Tax=Candidatus Chlorohelix allophototropha TaxID=3003348 RepID=A0A8T7LVT0_9CHLR|nr:(2Fe-2S)-binding protein [Chloroflexota bacterium]WJW66168.1 (2Fe-2S)-binding protein [Chloroflexota bacterium L227-S17]
MPDLIINNEVFEAEVGETIMDVARRNGAHIGFTCSRRGICTFCECKVEEGAELLNPITGNEKSRLSAERLENGSRLSCRAVFKAKKGTVRVTSRSEEVKQQFIGIFKAPTIQDKNDNLGALLGSVKQASKDYITMYPYVIKGIASGKAGLDTVNPFKDLNNLVQDSKRVFLRQIGLNRSKHSK